MKYMSVREMRNQSGTFQRIVASEPIMLTSNGRPFVLAVGLGEGEDPAELERMLVLARGQAAIASIRKRAKELGLDKMTEEEIEAEIQAARRERRAR